MRRYAFIDFEYNRSSEPQLNLVCCSITYGMGDKFSYWLHEGGNPKHQLINDIFEHHRLGGTFVSYSVEAEARSFIALDLDPKAFRWVDLYVEYRMLLNKNWKYAYGKQLIRGAVKRTTPPKHKYDKTEEEKLREDNNKPEHNLGAAIFNLLGILIDTAHKTNTRNLIISEPWFFSSEEQLQITGYCESDVVHLPNLLKAINSALVTSGCNPDTLAAEMHNRGRYSALSAIMVNRGYPVDSEALTRFMGAVPTIITDLQEDINLKVIRTNGLQPFRLDKDGYHMNQKLIKEWIAQQPFAKTWPQTEGKDFSLSKDSFENYCGGLHEYDDTLPQQMLRYTKTMQSFNGFKPAKENKKTILDFLGTDSRVRPFMGIFTAQSSRSQPGATGFIFLKSAWLRALVQPKSGWACGSIDYKSQEFLLAALLSGDKKMLAAYATGDVYIAFAVDAGLAPLGATKATHPQVRNDCKSTVLGIQYDLGVVAMAAKLTANSRGKKIYTPADAQKLVDLFYNTYSLYAQWKEDVQDNYSDNGYLKTLDNWYMFGDNDNYRSTGNCPVQAAGAAVMRKAVELAEENGVPIIFTLHDALYNEFKSDNLAVMDKMANAMVSAFDYFFPNSGVQLDLEAWSWDYPHDIKTQTPAGRTMNQQNRHVDERAISEWKKFHKYIDEDFYARINDKYSELLWLE